MGGRLVLINSILTSLPMFMLSFLRIPKGVLKKLVFGPDSFVNVMSIRKNTDLPNGAF
jgi:hypothetical protein